jgi:uncharacterized protein (DUF924 family)
MTEGSSAVPTDPRARAIVDFWIRAGPKKWFEKSAEFDREIAERFGPLVEQVSAGALEVWRKEPVGSLALILLLDQFLRNIYRDTPDAFAHDALALKTAEDALAAGHDKQFANPLRRFFYVPFMHAEDIELQNRCIALCRAAGDEEGVKYGVIHAEIIEKFGRFPHRNRILGRTSSEEEERFLAAGGFAG